MDDKLPRVPDLTPDERVWRMDWFGDVAYLHGTWQSAQPRLKVVMSPLTCASDDQDRLLTPTCTDHQHSVETRVPIAALPLLGIGDLWQNGRRVSSPDYTMECFAGLVINDTTTDIIKAGVSEDEKFYLPLSDHPWHRKHTQSYCVMVTRTDGTRIVIPAVELIRFYFGSTGNLVQRLFTRPLEADQFWSDSRYSSSRSHLHLTLATGLSGVSAADIGRIARNKSAWRAAARIYASCQKASVSSDAIYPYTMFPFKGRTDLIASGIWLPFGDQVHSTFLVYRLRSCSHPFPFTSMTYEAADRKFLSKQATSSGTAKTFAKRASQVSPKTVNRDPGSRAQQRRTAVFDVDHRFPDLARKRIWRNKVQIEHAANAFTKPVKGDSPKPQAFGEPSGSPPITAVDVSHAPSTDDPVLPDFVQEGIGIIRSDKNLASSNVSIHVIAPTNSKDLIFTLTRTLVIETASDDEWWADPETHDVECRACYVQIDSSNEAPHYLLIAESPAPSTSPDILETRRRSTVSADEAVKRGWPPKLAASSPMVFHGINEFDDTTTLPWKR